MAQTFQALRCYSCRTFQVQIKKKSNRWECKLCGEKQSLGKIFGEGSSKDCRTHVQKLNSMRGDQEELKKTQFEAVTTPEGFFSASSLENVEENLCTGVSKAKSKWEVYLEDDSGNMLCDVEKHEKQGEELTSPKFSSHPNTKWAANLEDNSQNTLEDTAVCKAQLMNSFNSRQLTEPTTSTLNDQPESVKNCQMLYCPPINVTFQRHTVPNVDAGSSHNAVPIMGSNIGVPSKNCHATCRTLKRSEESTEVTSQRNSDRQRGDVFCVTEDDELDEILNL